MIVKVNKTNTGFTLIEVVITMVLFGIITYVVATAISTSTKAYFVTDIRKEAIDQARIALDRMTREIRNVKSREVDADLDTYIDADIQTANASQFCFIDINSTRISFRYSGSIITREEGGAACPGAGGNTLAENITSMSFWYILADGTRTQIPADPTDIRRVQLVGLDVTINNETVTLLSEVNLRNL